MKKVLVPAALLVGLVGASHAQMTIYGLIDASYGKSIFADNVGQKADFHSGGDNGSSEGNSTTRFGLKGTTDIGSGIKANFRLESGGITSEGEVNPGGPFFARQAWVGFSGNFGEIRLGRQDSVAFQTTAGYDFNGASNGVSALGYSATAPWLPGRQSRSLQYISPTMGGVTVQVGFVPRGNTAGAKSTLSGAVTYAAGPLSLTATAEGARATGGKAFSAVAGTYDFGLAKVTAGYSDGQQGVGGTSLGFVVPLGKANVGMLYGKNKDTKGTGTEFFINSEVFKNTIAYFETGRASAQTGIKGTGYAVGVIYLF
jgi:predicted porin